MLLERSFVLLSLLVGLAAGFLNLAFVPLLHLGGNGLEEILGELQGLRGVSERRGRRLPRGRLLALVGPGMVRRLVPRLRALAGFLCLSSSVDEAAARRLGLGRLSQGLQGRLNLHVAQFGAHELGGGQLLLEPLEGAGAAGFVLRPHVGSRG